MSYIVTHTSPDWDAIGASWLLQRYGGIAGTVVFVNTGNPDPDVLDGATAVVDTGREYDPSRLRFDHHHFVGDAANERSAAKLVYDFLRDGSTESSLAYLAPIVDLIDCGDTGRSASGADASRTVGIHALLSAKKAQRLDDLALLTWGYGILDDLATGLRLAAEARAALERYTVYRSDDGLVVALDGAPEQATRAAHESGARLVLFHTVARDVPTVSVGMLRGGEGMPVHCGSLVAAVVAGQNTLNPLAEELATWYRHEAGFFAGRGSRKAPDNRPLVVPIAAIALDIDTVWER